MLAVLRDIAPPENSRKKYYDLDDIPIIVIDSCMTKKMENHGLWNRLIELATNLVESRVAYVIFTSSDSSIIKHLSKGILLRYIISSLSFFMYISDLIIITMPIYIYIKYTHTFIKHSQIKHLILLTSDAPYERAINFVKRNIPNKEDKELIE